MDAIVHIGIPKTGSTAMQAALRANRAALLTQGVLYPELHDGTDNQASLLASAAHLSGHPVVKRPLRPFPKLTSQEAYARFHERTDADLARIARSGAADRAFFSCEMLGWPFHPLSFKQAFADWIKSHFSGLSVILYLRAQDRWLLSEYSQQLKNGSARSLEEFLSRQKVPDYNRLVSQWEDVCGQDAVTIRLFDSAEMVDGDPVADLARAAGVSLSVRASEAGDNATLSGSGARNVRRVNALARRFGDDRALSRPARAVRRIATTWGKGSKSRLTLPDTDRHRILAQVKHGNARLCARRFDNRDSLFPTMLQPPTENAFAASGQPETVAAR